MNTDDQIRQGYRAKRFWAGKLVSVRLKRFRPSTFKYHLTRAKGKYVLTTYRDEVQFIPVDIDFHPPTLAEDEDSLFCDPEDLDATYAEFQASCEHIVDVFDRLGLKVIWYQSPGNVYNRKRWPGLNGVILLDQPEMKTILGDYWRALAERHDLKDIECHWTADTKLFRVPFQAHMHVCDPLTRKPLYDDPVEYPKYPELAAGCQHLNKMIEAGEVTSLSILREEWEKSREEKQQRTITQGEKRVRIDSSVDSDLVSLPDTFKAATMGRICSRLTNKYQADASWFEKAVEEGKILLKSIRPATSNTCSNPALLESTMRRWMTWYFRSYDPSKGNQARSKRDAEDRERLAYCSALDIKSILQAIGSSLSYDQKSQFVDLWKTMVKYNGRVAAKKLYANDNGLFAKRDWFSLLGKLSGILAVIVDHSVERHECRQWGLSHALVQKIGNMMKAREMTHAVLREEKKERVYAPATRHRSLDLFQTDEEPAVVTLSAFSKAIREEKLDCCMN